MTFTVAEAVQLVSWMVLVFWEPYMPSRKDIHWYNQQRHKKHHDGHHHRNVISGMFNLPSWVFPPVWFCLKLMVTASVFLYFKFVAEQNPAPTHYQYYVVYSFFLANILMAKLWNPLFFGVRMIGLAFANAVSLAVTAAIVVVFMGLSADTIAINYMAPSMYIAPLVLYIPYALWLIYACLNNWNWWNVRDKLDMKVEVSPQGFQAEVGFGEESEHRRRHSSSKKGTGASEPLLFDADADRRRR